MDVTTLLILIAVFTFGGVFAEQVSEVMSAT